VSERASLVTTTELTTRLFVFAVPGGVGVAGVVRGGRGGDAAQRCGEL